jgi:hypothetical protein
MAVMNEATRIIPRSTIGLHNIQWAALCGGMNCYFVTREAR